MLFKGVSCSHSSSWANMFLVLRSIYQCSRGYYLVNEKEGCSFCAMNSTDQFLNSIHALYSERWRNFGIFISFIVSNIVLAVFLYWLARVPKGLNQAHGNNICCLPFNKNVSLF